MKYIQVVTIFLIISISLIALGHAQFDYHSFDSWETDRSITSDSSLESAFSYNLEDRIDRTDLSSFKRFESSPEGVVYIDQCGILDQADTRYVLTQDIVATDTCFYIAGGSNITLDGDKYTVFRGCADGLGVYAEESKGITVQNIRFDCFGWGSLFINSSSLTFQNVMYTNTGGPALYLYNVSDFSIRDSFSNYTYGGGFVGEYVTNGLIEDSTITHHGGAGVIYQVYTNITARNISTFDTYYGLGFFAGSGLVTEQIRTSYNDIGILLYGATDFIIRETYSDRSYSGGIILSNSSAGLVHRVNSVYNYNPGFPFGGPSAGIKLLLATNVTIRDSNLTHNGYGVSCFGRFYNSFNNRTDSRNNRIEHVDVSYSDFDPINLNFACSENEFRHIIAHHMTLRGPFAVSQYGSYYNFAGISLYNYNENNTFYNISIVNSTQLGILLGDGSHGNTFELVSISQTPAGIYFDRANNTLFRDLSITNLSVLSSLINTSHSYFGANYSLYLTRSINTTIIDGTYSNNGRFETIMGSSTLKRLWSTRIRTIVGNATVYEPIGGATVSIVSGEQKLYRGTTGPKGYLPRMYLTEYSSTNSTRTNFTYTLYASHPKLLSTSLEYTPQSSSTVTIALQELGADRFSKRV